MIDFADNSENQKYLLIPLALESNIVLSSFQVGENIGEINTKHVEKASQKKTVTNFFVLLPKKQDGYFHEVAEIKLSSETKSFQFQLLIVLDLFLASAEWKHVEMCSISAVGETYLFRLRKSVLFFF